MAAPAICLDSYIRLNGTKRPAEFRRKQILNDSPLWQTKEPTMSRQQQAQQLHQQWETDPRWKGIKRGYTAEDVVRLRGSLHVEHTLAERGAEKLWAAVNSEPFVN